MRKPLPIKQRIDRVGQHIVRARLFFDLWWYFEGEDTRPQIIGIMRNYNEFFRFAPHAYLISYIIYIHGVFEPRPDTINLRDIVTSSLDEGLISNSDSNATRELIDGAADIVRKVAILRNKAFAHRDAVLKYDQVFELAGVTADQLRDLTEIALRASNSIAVRCAIPMQHFAELPQAAAINMMSDLARQTTQPGVS